MPEAYHPGHLLGPRFCEIAPFTPSPPSADSSTARTRCLFPFIKHIFADARHHALAVLLVAAGRSGAFMQVLGIFLPCQKETTRPRFPAGGWRLVTDARGL